MERSSERTPRGVRRSGGLRSSRRVRSGFGGFSLRAVSIRGNGQPRRHAKAARLGHRRAQRSPAYSLTRIRLNRGGYTSNGRYFGSGGAPVYQLMANDVYVFRAPTRAEAVATAAAITNLRGIRRWHDGYSLEGEARQPDRR